MDPIIMSKEKQLHIHAFCNLSSGKLTFREAMNLIGKSERTVRRWLRSYEKEGLTFIRHGNNARKPINRKSDEPDTAMELMELLVALVPRPRVHLTRYHGVLGPHYKYRKQITPKPSELKVVGKGQEPLDLKDLKQLELKKKTRC